MLPKVSIILSTEGKSIYFEQAIESIFNQSYKNWELLILVDGKSSKIQCGNIVKSSRVRIFELEKKIGLASALNFLISEASGELIARMDDDDLMMPHRIFRQVYEFQQKDIDLCCSMAELVDFDGLPYGLIPKQTRIDLFSLLSQNPIIHPTVMFKKGWAIKNRYNPDMLKAQDWELWIRSFKDSRISLIPEVLLWYRKPKENDVGKKLMTYKYQLNAIKYYLKDQVPWYFRLIIVALIQSKITLVTFIGR